MELSFANLLIVVRRRASRRRSRSACSRACALPAVVLEIVVGIVIGPAVLGWVEVDEPLEVLALVGLAFLLFLAGLEIDLDVAARSARCASASLGFALSLGLAVVAGLVLDLAGVAKRAAADCGDPRGDLARRDRSGPPGLGRGRPRGSASS